MFKKHSIQVKFVKDADQPSIAEDATKPVIDIEEISRHAEKLGKQFLKGTIIVMGAAAALATISQIAVNSADNAQKNKNEEK